MVLGISIDRGIYLPVNNVAKSECFSIDEAADYLNIKRPELYSHLNLLNVGRHRFPKDRKTYILKDDVERIKELLDQSSSR